MNQAISEAFENGARSTVGERAYLIPAIPAAIGNSSLFHQGFGNNGEIVEATTNAHAPAAAAAARPDEQGSSTAAQQSETVVILAKRVCAEVEHNQYLTNMVGVLQQHLMSATSDYKMLNEKIIEAANKQTTLSNINGQLSREIARLRVQSGALEELEQKQNAELRQQLESKEEVVKETKQKLKKEQERNQKLTQQLESKDEETKASKRSLDASVFFLTADLKLEREVSAQLKVTLADIGGKIRVKHKRTKCKDNSSNVMKRSAASEGVVDVGGLSRSNGLANQNNYVQVKTMETPAPVDADHIEWDDGYAGLQLFKEIHGHIMVPTEGPTRKLHLWIQHVIGNPNALAAPQIRALQKLGLCFTFETPAQLYQHGWLATAVSPTPLSPDFARAQQVIQNSTFG